MLTKTKVLAITRDKTLTTLLAKELNDGSCEIISTECSGTYLHDVIMAERPSFILLDIVMPSLDGIGTCLQLRQWTQTPIMMVSKWDTADSMVRGLNLGCDSYLTEPFSVDVLKTRMEDTLKRTSLEPAEYGSIRVSNN
jgi:DNA-binding response OmpR family regulator